MGYSLFAELCLLESEDRDRSKVVSSFKMRGDDKCRLGQDLSWLNGKSTTLNH